IAVGGARAVGVLPRDAPQREAVATVWRHVDLDGLAVQPEQRDRVLSGLKALGAGTEPVGQHDDAVVIRAETELERGADHAGADVAVGLARGDLEVPGQHTAGQDHRNQVTGLEVVRPADDPLRFARAVRVTDIDLAPVDGLAVLLLLGCHLQDATDHERTPDIAAVQPFLLQSDADQIGGHLDAGGASRQLGILPEPVKGNAHQISIPNCALKRTSPSIISRMSARLLRNISDRSTPMPKAKPW